MALTCHRINRLTHGRGVGSLSSRRRHIACSGNSGEGLRVENEGDELPQQDGLRCSRVGVGDAYDQRRDEGFWSGTDLERADPGVSGVQSGTGLRYDGLMA